MNPKEINKEFRYSNGEITIVWKPNICMGSTRCWRGLPEVFHHNERPWITANGADSQTIIDQVSKCPSGALSIVYNDDSTN